MTTTLLAEVHGRTVEIGCYGSGTDWLCRFIDPSLQEAGQHNDAYSPPPDLGFAWLRESDNMWLASGMVQRKVFRDDGTVRDLLYRVMDEVIHECAQLASCIEFVEAEFTVTFDGEQGPVEYTGSRK